MPTQDMTSSGCGLLNIAPNIFDMQCHFCTVSVCVSECVLMTCSAPSQSSLDIHRLAHGRFSNVCVNLDVI